MSKDLPSPMRVLLTGSWPPVPGISSYVHSLAKAISKKVSVRVLTFRHMYPAFLYPAGPPPTDETFPPDPPGIIVERSLDWYAPWGWIHRGFTAPADILHVQFWSLPIAPVWWVLMFLAWCRGIPRVITVHNLAGHESKMLYRWVTRRLIGLSNKVITHLKDPPEWFEKECERATHSRASYVPHGPLDLYQDVRHRPARPILPAGARGVLFFGTIRPYKGLSILLEAFDQVSTVIPNAWLVIAGRPWEPWDHYQQQIDAKPWRHRVVTRLEYIPTAEVAPYFESAELVVAPYLEFDSQSGAALSAIGMQKPLIVTSAGGLGDLQVLSEYVVRPGDVDALAKAILQAMSKPGELDRLAASARAIAGRSSWDEVEHETFSIYRALLLQKQARS
ncbi:glycosyltransferase family 4 protein [bacterium]|nr:glycosyltransferase family 4 protein [bacterium]